jgi:hypothetical protein
MRRRAAGDLGEDLLHDGAVTALTSSLGQLERGIGEGRVVTPGGKQFALPVSGLLVQVPDPADDQSRGDGLALFAANAVYRTSATWAPETQAPSWSSQTAGHRWRHRGSMIPTRNSPGNRGSSDELCGPPR